MKTNSLGAMVMAVFLVIVGLSCNDKKEVSYDDAVATSGTVTPVDFPKLDIPGFNFPEDSTAIYGWIFDNDFDQMAKHSWGIWTGLTSPTSFVCGGDTLLVYETWLTPDEIIDSIQGGYEMRCGQAKLNKPQQIIHAENKTGIFDDTNSPESVSYSPAAADYAIDYKIFMETTLAGYLAEGRTKIPDFPNDAITIKPVFKVIPQDSLNSDGLFAFPAWHGPISTVEAYPETAWGSCVYVDVNNTASGDGSMDMDCSGPTPQTTYNLTDFIYYIIDADNAEYFNQQFDQIDAKAGDYVILVGMHVTTREIGRWVWQTFWWASDPNNPPAPSNKTYADLRPTEYMHGAADHYAVALAYSMVLPAQPMTSGESVGDTLIAFNPYLEAGFGPQVFTGSNSYVVKNGDTIRTDAGVRTNCMSCHAYAAYTPITSGTPYTGDAYVDLNDEIFKNGLKLDFAWSINSNIVKDSAAVAKILKAYKPD